MEDRNNSQWKDVDLLGVDINTLKDIREVEISPEWSREARIREFLRQIGNPYCFRYGDMVVQVEYADEGPTLRDCIREYLEGQAL